MKVLNALHCDLIARGSGSPRLPVGDTGAKPYSMRQHADSEDYVDAACKVGAGDGSRWWYNNTWALSWPREQ